MTRLIDIVVKGYPRLSETFIAQEFLGLEEAGFTLRIWSLRHPTDKKRHAIHEAIRARVTYLPEYLKDAPRRVFAAWRKVRHLPGYRAALRAFLSDLAHDVTPNRIRRFGQALVLAAELPDDARHIHAHFIHTPGSVGRYAAMMRGLPLSFSAHARDIFTTPARELGVKIADARFVSVCTQDGANALTRAAPGFAARIHLIRHGIRLARFPLFEGTRPARDGKSADDPVRLLSVGRAVEKKGYDGLLRSLALLPRDLAWSFDHIGGGENVVALKAQAVALGLEGRIRFHGAQDSTKVLEAMRAADLFVLFARIARDGDRDGIPNVIVEAASQALPVAATRVGGIGEAVREGETGLLCEEGDEAGFARIMAQLIAEPNLRAQLGTKAQENIPRDFSFDAGLARLRALFEGVA
ncbi:MAG TPA: glycosyltransferase [Micropepsaceae bacterium]|nr:glycosyltransferase [Micropepsaceae bacterium]